MRCLYSTKDKGINLLSFSFSTEESFIEDIINSQGHSYACQVYAENYRQLRDERSDEVVLFLYKQQIILKLDAIASVECQ